MVELDAKFEAAVGVIQGLPKDGSFQPSNEMKLKFYGFYKQAREGPCTGARPGFWDVVARAKYDAWKVLGDMSSVAAKEGYIEALKQIIETINLNSDVEKFIEVTDQNPNFWSLSCPNMYDCAPLYMYTYSLKNTGNHQMTPTPPPRYWDLFMNM